MFEDLIEKINKIEENVNLLLQLYMQQANSLTTYNEVSKFLGKTRKTVYRYIQDGKFVLDVHYYKDENDKTVFIPQAIIEFKNGAKVDNTLSAVNQLTKQEANEIKRINHPIVNSMLKGVA